MMDRGWRVSEARAGRDGTVRCGPGRAGVRAERGEEAAEEAEAEEA